MLCTNYYRQACAKNMLNRAGHTRQLWRQSDTVFSQRKYLLSHFCKKWCRYLILTHSGKLKTKYILGCHRSFIMCVNACRNGPGETKRFQKVVCTHSSERANRRLKSLIDAKTTCRHCLGGNLEVIDVTKDIEDISLYKHGHPLSSSNETTFPCLYNCSVCFMLQ